MSQPQSHSYFQGKTCVVTGANRGIGLALCRALAVSGASVLAGCRRPQAAQELQALVKESQGRLRIETIDVSDDKSVAHFASHVPERLDVLFNNAGINLPGDTSPSTTSAAVMLETFNVNTLGPLRVTQSLLGKLHAASGRVANISSIMGSVTDNGIGGSTAYRVSKAGLNMLNKNFSLHEQGLIFLTMHPGWVKTDMGGKQNAPIEPEQSAAGLMKMVADADLSQSGTFIRFDGKIAPW